MNDQQSALKDLPDPGLDPESLREDVARHYGISLGRDLSQVNRQFLYEALAVTIRDRLVARWRRSRPAVSANRKEVAYLSLEFLMGRALTNAVHALDLEDSVRDFLLDYGLDLETVAQAEHDAGLGNGGLGRLAACFLDSCASMELPVTGYGIRYEYGMFHQRIEQGRQIEAPDHWLREGNPWELERSEDTCIVRFRGRTEIRHNPFHVAWVDTQSVLAVPYDILVPGYHNDTVNVLRLWKADGTDEFDLEEFNAGSYSEAVTAKNEAENVTMVLYPNDVSENGKALRFRQHYFLASATLQDIVRKWVRREGEDFSRFAESHVFQLNDTHPAFAVPELMRLLVDEYRLPWEEAWDIVTSTMAYTNHTLLPEALEMWSVDLFRELLPRILEIIYEINARFLGEVSRQWPGDNEKLRTMSLIEEGNPPRVRMAYLAIVGSFSVNGVAELHSKLLKRHLFHDFCELWPEKFNNKTNGVTPRRWLQYANPTLSALITAAVGDGWKRDLQELSQLREHAEEAEFRARWQEVKLANKRALASLVAKRTGIRMDADWLLDVQVKRIHEYKRQLLKVLHVIHLYDRIHRGDGDDIVPRTVLIGGKAAPGYEQAKRIIHFVNAVGETVNNDRRASRRLQLIFLPNYDVSSMEVICPAAELSEQISTAGKEASGTGNMKFMMNGAVTIGTLDGANIEIRERAGKDNFFTFGMTAEEVEAARQGYDPLSIIGDDEDLGRVLRLIECDHFNLFSPGAFSSIVDSIRNSSDPWMLAADFRSYVDQQAQVERAWQNAEGWQRMSILNTAASGFFSSDRTISEYASDIWGLTPVAPAGEER